MEGNNSNATVHSRIVNNHALALSFVAICSLTVIENIVGLVVIRLNPVLHTTANKFVCSLAVVDIVTGVCLILANVFSELSIRSIFPCTNVVPYFTVTKTTGYSSLRCSMIHLTIIAFERYVFIAHPFVYRRRVNNKTIAIVLAMFWIYCVIYITVIFGLNSVAELNSYLISNEKPTVLHYISFYYSGPIFLLCSILTAIAYGLIVKVAIKRNRIKRERNHITQTDESSKNALKTIKFFMVVYGLFAISTMPVFILNILRAVYGIGFDYLVQLSILPLMFVPGINFFVLTVLNADFRSALKKTLAGLCRRHR